MPQQQWKIGDAEQTQYGVGSRVGYGFIIENSRGAPLLNVTYATREEAEQAGEAIRKALTNAVAVMGF